ncbi:diguanylate cyclase (GGDEF)-like protein [Neorhizobium galegae]|uniref:GGDEF domain-containing protein n=1 Tax=Rhizobium/Agrobacterium group TaxID=227290 RepID=UPI001AE1201A|nr:GGDEF domain-containing protein [Neorhizobium galegae]MBP2549617.1 diguanylate cyclase (GGDEF)-like protein [Neorhizobium galegae]
MNGADFFLVMNFFIAMSFAVVFIVVSTRSRSREAARWFAAGFAVASLSAPAELLVAHTDFVRFGAWLAFATVLAGLLLLRVGIGKLYGAPADRVMLVIFCCAALATDALIYPLPRGSLGHAFLYQMPFGIALLFSALAVMRSPYRAAVDRALLTLLLVTAAHFPLKAALAVIFGAGVTAKDYIGSNYALISQSMTAVLMVMTGLMLLAVLVLQIMADERSNSEVDALSSLLNRRGFDNHCERLLRRQPNGPYALILCDLDHFKKINDTYGHLSGDSVISLFGQLLTASAPDNAIIGRIGGEEFCVLLPGQMADAALMLAQALRGSLAMQVVPGLPPAFRATASFGVSTFSSSADLSTALRQADRALYEAKEAGRNCVRLYRQHAPMTLTLV